MKVEMRLTVKIEVGVEVESTGKVEVNLKVEVKVVSGSESTVESRSRIN